MYVGSNSSVAQTIGAPAYTNKLVKKYALNPDIIEVLNANFKHALKQVAPIAQQYKGSSITDTAYNIWSYLRNQIRYVKDSTQAQLIRLPKRFVADAEGDCKSYSLFAASLLKSIYPESTVVIRYAGYLPYSNIPTHVYTAIIDAQGQETIVDGVYKHFNKEKPYTYKKDYKMNVYTLAGHDGINGGLFKKIGQGIKKTTQKVTTGVKKTVQKVGEGVKKVGAKVVQGAAKVYAAPARGAFLTLVQLNFRGFGTKITQAINKDYDKVKKFWQKLGGDIAQLKRVAAEGAKKKMLFGIGEPVAASVATAITAATPVVVATVAMLKKLGLGNKEIEDVAGAAAATLSEAELAAAEEAAEVDTDSGSEGMSTQTKVLLGVGAAALVLFAGKKMFK